MKKQAKILLAALCLSLAGVSCDDNIDDLNIEVEEPSATSETGGNNQGGGGSSGPPPAGYND